MGRRGEWGEEGGRGKGGRNDRGNTEKIAATSGHLRSRIYCILLKKKRQKQKGSNKTATKDKIQEYNTRRKE